MAKMLRLGLASSLLALASLPLAAQSVSPELLNQYQPGFRTIDGSQLNKMVDAVNVQRSVAYQPIVNGSALYTYTFPNYLGTVVFVSANTITEERVTAPPNPFDGQVVRINSTHTITTFQFIANTGQTLAVTTPTALTASTTANQGYAWVYRASDAKWYRLQ